MAASAVSQREPLEARLKGLAQCYMNCVKVSATAARKTRDTDAPYKQDCLLYSVFAEKGLAKTSASGSVDFGYVSPFWAVMLTDRNNAKLVNMHPYVEEYKLPSPVADVFPMKFHVNIKITLPFLTNKESLVPGELLVLPFDGGCNQIFSAPPSIRGSF